MIGLSVKYNYYIVGHSSFLECFFNTVRYHFEQGKWQFEATLFFKDLYNGKVHWQDAPELIRVLKEVRTKLSILKTSDVVWDIDDLSKRPPWEDNISDDIISLANYFRTSDVANDLIDVMNEALQK